MAPRESVKIAVAFAALLVVAALVVAAFALPYYDDDVCITNGPAAEGTSIRGQWSLVPAGTECTYRTPSGERVERFEGPGDWHSWTVLGLIATAIATLLVGLTMAMRDLRMRDTPA